MRKNEPLFLKIIGFMLFAILIWFATVIMVLDNLRNIASNWFIQNKKTITWDPCEWLFYRKHRWDEEDLY